MVFVLYDHAHSLHGIRHCKLTKCTKNLIIILTLSCRNKEGEWFLLVHWSQGGTTRK